MQNTIDLNIENYDLDDILGLFKISRDFDENDLKRSKQIVLKTHPDKSRLPPEYFLFYSKAYKMIYQIWEFKNKDKLNKQKEQRLYLPEEIDYQKQEKYNEKERKQLLDSFLSKQNWKDTKNSKEFNQWFNQQFEKYKLETEEQQNGYGEWLQSNEDLDEIKEIHHTQLGEEIERKKREIRSLVVHKEISELEAVYSGVSNLTGEAPESYGAELFSGLPFEDLRKAHTETVIPVTMEDYHTTKKFKDVNEYKHYRSSQNVAPLSEQQANEYLNNKYKLQERETTERGYQLAKQLEESNKKQQQYWGSLKYLDK
jgi:hypothetical protein